MKMPKVILAGVVSLALLGTAACGGDDSSGDASTSGGGSGATTEFRLAFNQTEDHPEYKAAVTLGEKLSDATDGRYSIKVYANEQLGTQNEVIDQISDGSIDMMWVGGPVMESYNQDFIVFNLPYVFDSEAAQADVFADDAVVGDLFSSLEDSKNITVLAAVHAGVRNVYNAVRPIKEPADLAGLKIRVQQSDSQTQMMTQMGGVATAMGQGDVYSALQSTVLDGAENNETVYNSLKHDEVAKYYSYTKHLMIPDYLLISTKALNAMSDEDRQAFLDLIPSLVDDANTGMDEFVKTSIENSKANGAEFNDDVDTDAFKAAVQPLVDQSINNDVRQKLYDAVQAANEKHQDA